MRYLFPMMLAAGLSLSIAVLSAGAVFLVLGGAGALLPTTSAPRAARVYEREIPGGEVRELVPEMCVDLPCCSKCRCGR